MLDMCGKFHTNNLACLRGCYDQLCQMLRTGQAVLIKINVFRQELKGYHLQFFEVMSLYYGEAGIRIERCRKECYDLSNLQAAGEQLSKEVLRLKINFIQVYNFQICLYQRNIF